MNYYYLKLYGIPIVPVTDNKYTIASSPLLVTSTADKKNKNLRRLIRTKNIDDDITDHVVLSSYSKFTPLLLPTSKNLKMYSYDGTNEDGSSTGSNYEENVKIHEAQIPYISARLIKYGKVPLNQMKRVFKANITNGTSKNSESELITWDAIQELETNSLQNSNFENFKNKYYELCEGTGTTTNTTDCCIIYAYETSSSSAPTKFYAHFDFPSSPNNKHTFIRSDRNSIYFSKSINPSGQALYMRDVATEPNNGLYFMVPATSGVTVTESIMGHHMPISPPLRLETTKDTKFYLWKNAEESYYLTVRSVSPSDTPDIYTFNKDSLQYTLVPSGTYTYTYVDSTLIKIGNYYYYYSPRVLEKLNVTASSQTSLVKGNYIKMMDDPNDKEGLQIQIGAKDTSQFECQFEPVILQHKATRPQP